MSIVPTTPARNRDLAKIHGEARRQGMSDFARRALQYEVTGKESALLMNEAERAAVIAEMTRERMQPAPAPKFADDDCSDEAMLELLWG